MLQPRRSVTRQVERILDEDPAPQLEVVVQMPSSDVRSSKLALAAGTAIARRRFVVTPRDLLPLPYRRRTPAAERSSTASSRALLGQRGRRPYTLDAAQKRRRNPMSPLLSNDIVRAAIGRMREARTKGGRNRPVSGPFWTSSSLPLRLRRDELRDLPAAVQGIRAIHSNRMLSVPALTETRPLSIESEEILVSTWGLEKINALAVWGAYEVQGEGVTIGLLDTGVDARHPDLEGKIAHWAQFDSLGREVPDSVPHDSDEHGTHCAGTLVGGDHSGRHIGVAPRAKLAAAMVLDGTEGGTDAQILAGIDWAVERRVDVLSLSLGGLMMEPEVPPTYTEAILTCVEAGIPVVVAIGNEGQQTTGSPGNDLFALSIGATDPADRAAGFSGGRTQIIRESDFVHPDNLPLSYSKPDLSAPGVAVYSTSPGNGWQTLSGTSMATPHVAGSIALLLSATDIRAKEIGEHRTFLIHDLISGSVEDLGESGQDHRFGFGRLDVLRAVDLARQRSY